MDQFNIKKPEKEFFRPRTSDDSKYRRIQKATFSEKLQNILPKTSTLCFHATTIWNTKNILESGYISAAADRGKNIIDTNSCAGKISVTTIDSLWFSVKQFADLSNFDYPAGCIFVLTPKDKEEFLAAKSQHLISNVYFDKESHRLQNIITTPENIERVRKWVQASPLNLNPDIVVDYEKYINNSKETYLKEKERGI